MRNVQFFGLLLVAQLARGAILPVITLQPTNQTVAPGGTANFSVTASGATAFQWRYDGSDIPNATNALLQISNAQTNNTGYYMVIVRNSTGLVPSALAYLATGLPEFDTNEAVVPFSNVGLAQAQYQGGSGPITNAIAAVTVGPELDEMQTISNWTAMVSNGYFNGEGAPAPTVMPGQKVYYRVGVSYMRYGVPFTQISTTLRLTTTKSPDLPDASNLKFPTWPEWPEPGLTGTTPTNQIRIPGETVTLTNGYFAYTDFGWPTCQWRKDGQPIPGATNFVQTSGGAWGGYYRAVLTLTNVQAGDAGVYDAEVFGNNWLIGPKTALSVQLTDGPGTLQAARTDNTNFIADLVGIAGRQYTLQWSSNLSDWSDLWTVTNISGTLTFTNSRTDGNRFYRSVLLP